MRVLLVAAAAAAVSAAAVNSGFEVGVYSLSLLRLRYRLSTGDARARALHAMLERPERLIAAILVAQNTAVYFVTAVVASLVESAGVKWAEAFSSLLLAVVFFIFVEAVPKNVFRNSADVLVYPLARVYRYVIFALMPAIVILRGITRLVLRFAGARSEGFAPVFTRDRLAFYMREGHSAGVLSRYQVELAQNILRAEKVTVARAMVPMAKVAAVGEGVSWEQFRRISRESGFSRYPVYRGEKSKIVGLLNIYDCHLVKTDESGPCTVVRPAVYFKPDVRVTQALRALKEARQPMGIVEDESGAAGIVTVKDCVEEIVGELHEW